MIVLLRYITLIMILNLILVTHLRAEDQNFLESDGKFARRLRQEFADLDITFDIDFFNLELFEGANIASRYRYEVTPSYVADHHTRVDKWVVNFGLGLQDMISENLPLSFGIGKGSEIYFVRQFEKKSDAMKATPYSPRKLPINAEAALNELNVGDFVSLPANMSLTFSVDVGKSPLPEIDTSARVYYVLSGQFLIHIFRMKDGFVRLKLFATKGYVGGMQASIKFDYEPFGISQLNNEIERIFDYDLFDLSYQKGGGDQLVLDYVFDLKDQMAKKAYDDILSSTYKFKDLEILKEHIDRRGLEKRLISNFKLAEDISYEDKSLRVPRVRRIFKGFNNYNRENYQFGISILLSKMSENSIYVENFVSFEDPNRERKHFYYPVFTEFKSHRIGFWPLNYEEDEYFTLFGLSEVDKDGNGDNISDLGFSYEIDDNYMTAYDQRQFLKYIRATLPRSIYKLIDWQEWRREETRKGVKGLFRIIFKGEAFKDIEKMSQRDLTERYLRYYKRLAKNNLEYGNFFDRLGARWRGVNFYLKERIKSVTQKLYQVLYTGKSGREVVTGLLSLRDEKTFNKGGVGFLISLIDPAKLDNLIHVRLDLHGLEVDHVQFKYGTNAREQLHEELMHIQNAINNRSYDLRYNDDSYLGKRFLPKKID